jgi:hypothetical protein
VTTTYEFVVETLDEYGDIIDCPAFDALTDASVFAEKCDEPWRIALRRDTGSNEEGLTDRFYAYPDASGNLPERMETCDGAEDGPDVPKRFRNLIFPVFGEKP